MGGGAQRPVRCGNEPQKTGAQFRQAVYLAGRYDNPIPTRFLAPHRLFKNSSTGSPTRRRGRILAVKGKVSRGK
jgi:hypothetical protein